MAKSKGDGPADWEKEKIARAQKGAADLGVRRAEVGKVFTVDIKTVNAAHVFSTVADTVGAGFKAQADHARGGKKRGESHAKRNRQICQWAAEWRAKVPELNKSAIVQRIKSANILPRLEAFDREATERAEDAYARWTEDVADPQYLDGPKRRAHKEALDDEVATKIKRNRKFWDLSERRIQEIISLK